MPVAFATCGIVFAPIRFQEEILPRMPVARVLVAEVVPPRPAHDHDLDRVALRVHAELAVAVEGERAEVALGSPLRPISSCVAVRSSSTVYGSSM